ncbi:MAG: thioredoxin family protein [Pseudomonadales bacterium]
MTSFLAVTDLQEAGCQAATQRLPLVVYMARTDCTFCRRLEGDVLRPLIAAGVLEGRAIYVQLLLDADTPIVNFDGTVTSAEAIAEAHGGALTPTFLFLDGAGGEIAPPLVGYNGSEFYSAYFERRLQQAAPDISSPDCQAQPHP